MKQLKGVDVVPRTHTQGWYTAPTVHLDAQPLWSCQGRASLARKQREPRLSLLRWALCRGRTGSTSLLPRMRKRQQHRGTQMKRDDPRKAGGEEDSGLWLTSRLPYYSRVSIHHASAFRTRAPQKASQPVTELPPLPVVAAPMAPLWAYEHLSQRRGSSSQSQLVAKLASTRRRLLVHDSAPINNAAPTRRFILHQSDSP